SPLAISNYIYDYETYIGTYLLTYTVPEGEEGIYILKLEQSYANTSATIVIPGINNAIKGITTQNTVKVQGNVVTITPENNARTHVEIYDITGKKIAAKAIYGTTSFSIEQRGIYIVKINNDVKKIAISR
ncbi:MAG TPA: T9SS type A sorting domain-containing protein, partial [Candidatus Barnesiella excrementipullorum]|nr:T9SS type A sorting domain-containing protein [Candidatus Barnesiella excrementipullorum]